MIIGVNISVKLRQCSFILMRTAAEVYKTSIQYTAYVLTLQHVMYLYTNHNTCFTATIAYIRSSHYITSKPLPSVLRLSAYCRVATKFFSLQI
jgi:hypothetical protein